MNKRELLASINICNPHNLTPIGHPMIYLYSDLGRGGFGRAWVLGVIGKRFKTDHWFHNGKKWFSFYGASDKPKALQDAIEFAQRVCPGVEMVKGPWPNTYVVKADLEEALAKAKEAMKEKVEVEE